MKPQNALKAAAQLLNPTFETLENNLKPFGRDILSEVGPLFGAGLGRNPKSLAKEDLDRARQKQKAEQMDKEDKKKSAESARRVFAQINSEYRKYDTNVQKEQRELKEEIVQLQSEVVKLAKTAGVDTKVHLETMPKKVGVLDIRRLTIIVRYLRLNAEESKSAKELVSQRSNAKRSTGMLAWVSGKQMKIHEQGTLQLQG